MSEQQTKQSMPIFVQKKVFNDELKGKAVHIEGCDKDKKEWNGVYLVSEVFGEYIVLVNVQGEKTEPIHLESFEASWGSFELELTVLG